MNEEPWEVLLDELGRDESILEQTISELRASVPGYESVPTAAVEASARRNIVLSIRTIRSGRQPRPEDVKEADALAAERHAQGVPIGSVLAGFRVCMSTILDRLLHMAPRVGIPADQVLASSTLLWALGDAFSTRAVVVYQEKEISRAVADSARRAEWIGDAVVSGMDAAELMRGATRYEVPTTAPVRAVVAHSTAEPNAERQRRLHCWAEMARVRVLTAVRAGSLVGIMVGTPDAGVQPEDLTVGMGRPVLLGDLPRSFESASLALDAANRIGQAGLVDIGLLSWRLAVHSSPETTAMLCEKYLGRLKGTGVFGEHVLEAVDAYLSHRLNIPSAARSIPVHVNTLRYRLQRFSQLTGADLGDVDTLIEVAWALAARAGRKLPQDLDS